MSIPFGKVKKFFCAENAIKLNIRFLFVYLHIHISLSELNAVLASSVTF